MVINRKNPVRCQVKHQYNQAKTLAGGYVVWQTLQQTTFFFELSSLHRKQTENEIIFSTSALYSHAMFHYCWPFFIQIQRVARRKAFQLLTG